MDETNENAPTPGDLRQTVRRLTEVELILAQAKEERVFLRQRIVELMTADDEQQRQLDLDGQPVVLRVQVKRKVSYDEEKLRERLGERYRRILTPDARKLRKHVMELGPALEPHLELIGSPAPDLVQSAIAEGVVTAAEFKGAFRKDTTRTLSVRRPKPRTAEPTGGENTPY